ncbi:MAG: hypothetical protein A2V86_15980 [Deltaproteobacteria bacterium RBG_16_49_23]|nr:MAG: hypothetical protein A2V86_15980 [Deltaproteobacteria bacterium RBG_16_49_23]
MARFDPLGLVIPDSRLRIDLRGEPGTVINQVEVRLRTVPVVGDYSVVTPFGTFVVPVNNLNETIVILPGAAQGITADNFVGALAGNVEFFFTNGTGNLVNPALGTFWGDGATPAPLLMPPGFVLPPDGALTFRVIGPLGSGVDAAQPNFTVEGKVNALPLPPAISVTPATHNFGNINVGSVAINRVTIANLGSGNLTIGLISLAPVGPIAMGVDTCSGQTLLPAGSCTVQVRFLPLSVAVSNATLSIPSNDPVTPLVNVTLTGSGVGGQVFGDVLPTSLFENHINSLFNNGITTGCAPGQFCPQSLVTRGEMSAFIIRAVEGEPLTGPPTPTFGDVPLAHPFFRYVERMVVRGITLGIGGGLYGPDLNVTRAEMASFIVRAVDGADAPGPCTGFFTDVPIGAPHCANIERLRTLNVTLGCSAGLYCPAGRVLREQMAAFIARAFLGIP